MDGQLFQPGSKVLVRGRWSSSLPSPGPYIVRSLHPLYLKSNRRKPTRLCRFRDGMFRVELETGSGVILEQKFRPRHLEPIVDLAAENRIRCSRLSPEDSSELHDVDSLLSDDEEERENECLPKRSESHFGLRTLKQSREHVVVILGPHRITNEQLTVLQNGVGELADSILDGFCYAISRSPSFPCTSSDRVELVSSLSLACMLTATQAVSRSPSSSVLRLKQMWQRWANRRIVLGPYLLQTESRNHWILLAFSIYSHEVWILDSLDQRSKFTKLILKLLRACSSLLSNDRRSWRERGAHHNLQTDDESCGLFVLEFIRRILQNNGKIPPSIRVDTDEARSFALKFLIENSESMDSQRSSDVIIVD